MMVVTSNQATMHESSASLPNTGGEQLSALHIRRCMDEPLYIEGQAQMSIEQQSRDDGTLEATPSCVSVDKERRV
jgi:hypothetical protein